MKAPALDDLRVVAGRTQGGPGVVTGVNVAERMSERSPTDIEPHARGLSGHLRSPRSNPIQSSVLHQTPPGPL